MEQDCTQIKLKEKLKLYDIFKRGLTFPSKNYKLIIFSFFLCLPFFCSLVFFEIIFQRICLETSKFFEPRPFHSYYYNYHAFGYMHDGFGLNERLKMNLFPKLVQLCVVNLIPYQLLEFLNILIIVPRASRIYEAEKPVSFKDIMGCKTRLKGPLITSIYVHLLSTIILFALAGSAINCCIEGKSFQTYSYIDILLTMVDGIGFSVLLVKFLGWGAGWNMALVISMLDEKDGIKALKFSAQIISRNYSRQWLMLMIVSFAWGFIIRLSCIFIDENDELVVTGALFTCCLSCIGNVLKWVICVVYFLDCKDGSLKRKVVNI